MEITLPAPEIITPSREAGGKGYTGYLILTLSLFIFILGEHLPDTASGDGLPVFFLHYFLAIAFTGVQIYQKRFGIRRCWLRENIHHTTQSINLFLISAFALNRVLPVFDDSTTWLCVYIILTSASLLRIRLYNIAPVWARAIQFFLVGSAMVYYLYLSLYIAPYYVLGAAGVLALGIGAHVLVPLFLLSASLSLVIHFARTFMLKCFVCAGVFSTCAVIIAFSFEWNRRVADMETFSNQSVLSSEDNDLPVWVSVAENIPSDWISDRILKSDLVYTTAPERLSHFDLFPFNDFWDEPRRHDPLVYLASLNRKTSLSREDRVRILKAITGARHTSQERYWSGESLTTSYIVSDIDIYPGLRLAYTEKYFNVRNNRVSGSTWRNSEEAIYTFQLPEGSVISSLSLWIDGKEEKALLTSRQKAGKAYRTIVGVEQRDPSVVHWQEGNTVVVRVFPCTPEEERKFKIGITTPLPVINGKTTFRNIVFAGPDPANARETTRIRFLSPASGVDLPSGFSRDSKGDMISEHRYTSDLSIAFDKVPIRDNRFFFDGYEYSLADYLPTLKPASFNRVYLDLNSSWTHDELDEIKGLLLSAPSIYAAAGGKLLPVTRQNWDRLVPELARRNFTLFPFHLLNDPSSSLVITKGNEFTPHLSDFRESRFAGNIRSFFKDNRVKVFNLPGGISTYISSLRELRTLDFVQDDLATLNTFLKDRVYPTLQESDQSIVLHDAHVMITRSAQDQPGDPDTAPDHLTRLFAYNNIMRKIGSRYFKENFADEALAAEASKAYVVTPVSSLVVLESQADYDRFGISQTQNSLYNASKNATGAVPEPHEWALIIVFALFVLYVKFRN